MKKWLLLTAILAAGLLVSCGLEVPFKQYYYVKLSPDQWGFEADSSGNITVVGNQAVVVVSPGAPEGVLESVDVTYYDNDGNPVYSGDPGYTANLPVVIPAGIVCGGEATACSKSDADWSYGWAESSTFTFGMDGKIATAMLDAFTGGQDFLNWRAHVIFHARTSTGKSISWEQDIKITYPLKAN
ncbi:hypothetical protein [Oceanithermus sp.]